MTKTPRMTAFAGVLAAALLAVTSISVAADDHNELFDDLDELPNITTSFAGPLQLLFATDDDADDVLEKFGVDLDDAWEIDDADDDDELVARNGNGRFLVGNAGAGKVALCLWASEPDDRDECLGTDDDGGDDDDGETMTATTTTDV